MPHRDFEWVDSDGGRLEFDCPVHGCENSVPIIGDLCHVCKLDSAEHDTCSIPECVNPSMRSTWSDGKAEYREGGITGSGPLVQRFFDETKNHRRTREWARIYYFFDNLRGDNYPRNQISIQEHKQWGRMWQLSEEEIEGEMCRSCFEERYEKVQVKLYSGFPERVWVWAPKNTQSPRSNRRRRNFGKVRLAYGDEGSGNWGQWTRLD